MIKLRDNKKSYFTIILFLFIILSPYIIWPIVNKGVEGENKENRTLAEMPELSWAAISDFPESFEEFLNDHLPFRDNMIELNSAIKYYLFRSSSNKNVSVGKEGWLFYTGEKSTAFYNGRKLYTNKQLKKIARNMQNLKNCLAERNIHFVLYIVPNKERVYSEYLPNYYGAPAEQNALAQVIEYLKTNTDVEVVCPYDSFIRIKKENPDILLYRKTDTHWNELGAYLGTCELLEKLGINLEEKITVQKIKDFPGDLCDMMNMGDVLDPGDSWTVSGYQTEDTECISNEFYGSIKYRSPLKNTGKILICRDSFCTAMAPIIGTTFTESNMVHRKSFTTELIDQENPDYFVYEVAERYLDVLLTFTYE